MNCISCGRAITPYIQQKYPGIEYCCKVCARVEGDLEAFDPRRYGRALVGPTSLGAASELVVCADLIRRGIEAYLRLSHNCSVDVVAIFGGVCRRIEVRTGYIGGDGIAKANAKDPSKYDILAIVTDFSDVHYRPPLSEAFEQDAPTLDLVRR